MIRGDGAQQEIFCGERLRVLLSLFCGAGGLDAGFENAGFDVGLAYDKRSEAVRSYNINRPSQTGRVADISVITLDDFDRHNGGTFKPLGVIGGPPCQSFSKANSGRSLNDPRAQLVNTFTTLCLDLHKRSPLDFVVMENVPELIEADEGRLLGREVQRLQRAGFRVSIEILNAVDFGVPQKRKRMFLVALNKSKFSKAWRPPVPLESEHRSVGSALEGLPEPIFFDQSHGRSGSDYHPNHWCMTPKSRRFFDGTLKPGYSAGRSFKTLSWEKPSLAVSYGNREVHIHPSGKRRLSVFEAMLLQGFASTYVLEGTMSSQITQVSEAVPPPLAMAVAKSLPVDSAPSQVSISSSYARSVSPA